MSRPPRERVVTEPPRFRSYKPAGVPRKALERVTITLDEFEAVKLADLLELDQQEAADRMGISRSTFSRLVAKARRNIVDALVNGRELAIEGGSVHFVDNILTCTACGHQFTVPMEAQVRECPACGADELRDYAGSFGHGRCCRGFGLGKGMGRGGRGGRG